MDGFPNDAVCSRVPGDAEPYVRGVLAARSISIRISRPRRTKLGDHRPPSRGEPMHRISVNDDLNPYAFLTTLLHEVAHADVWERHPRRWRRPKPHGCEWQEAFRELLAPVVAGGWLPQDVASALEAVLLRGQPGRIYNAVDDEPVLQEDFLRFLAESTGRPLPPLTDPADAPGSISARKRGNTNKRVSNRRLRDELGWRPEFPTHREGYSGAIAALVGTPGAVSPSGAEGAMIAP